MSPILTRPVREQLEHDRVIRQLQARYKRKTDVIINPGNEQNQSITVGDLVVYPDLLLFAEGSRKLLATVEVETGESVNPIEARAEWGVYSKLKVPLHLYVPPACVDAVKRICAEYQILVSELYTYTTSFDQVRFNLVYKSPDALVLKVPERSAAAPQKAQSEPQKPPKAQNGPGPQNAPKAQNGPGPLKSQKAAPKPGPQKPQKAQNGSQKAAKVQKVNSKAKPAAKPAAKKAKPVARPKAKAGAKKRK